MRNIPILTARGRLWLLVCTVLVAVLAIYPFWTDPYSLSVVRDALIFGLFALSLDFLWGKGGILSFGQAAFFGIGAYGTGILAPMVGGGNASLVGAIGGVGIAMGVALLVGYFLIFGGVRGAYLTIVTLALALVAQHIVIGSAGLTGGDAGLIGIPPPAVEIFGAGFVFFDPTAQYYLVLGIAVTALLAIWIPCRGQYGKILMAIQDNELRARTLGYNTSLHLLVVFALSAGLAALAGALYATVSGFVAPDLIGLLLSTEVIVWVAVGGRGTLIGPFIGAFVVLRLQQEVSSIDTKLWPILIGSFFVAMVFLFPRGVLPLVQRIPGPARSARQRRRAEVRR
jgi:ABC-type branched-subunit amino acid transport system permease subunit